MKIYNVKVLKDISSIYNGLDDISVYSFNNLEDAQNRLQEEFELAQKNLLGDETDMSILNIDKDPNYFEVNDEVNYIKGEVVETELELDIYAITTVSVDQYEPAAVSTYFRASKEDADLEYENLRNELYNDKLEAFEEEEDEDQTAQEKLDDFIDDYVQHDYEFQNGNRYFHLVEESGDELVILTEKLDFKEEE